MHRCSICQDLAFSSHHTCKPLWEVCDPACDPTHWIEIRADDEEDAAAEYCELEDISSADYLYIRNGGADRILVRKPGTETYVEVGVTAESNPVYSGRIIKPSQTKEG